MGVWVISEYRETLQRVSMELIGKARELSDELNEELTAVVLGWKISDCADFLIQHGADHVIFIEHELLQHYTAGGYTKVLSKLINERKPSIVLIGATHTGRDLAPRLAARLKTGLTADCTHLEIDPNTKNLLMTRPAFSGNLMATIECPVHRPQMATVRPGVFPMTCANPSRKGTVESIEPDLSDEDLLVIVEKIMKIEKSSIDISEAKIVVSGGRGVGSKKGFDILHELAEALGGTVAGSRGAVEAGWIEKEKQVGQTGKIIKPKLYIACGISGAIQHIAGMHESEYIIAINKDPEAPIMSIADLAVVGDLHKIVPQLTKLIREHKLSCKALIA